MCLSFLYFYFTFVYYVSWFYCYYFLLLLLVFFYCYTLFYFNLPLSLTKRRNGYNLRNILFLSFLLLYLVKIDRFFLSFLLFVTVVLLVYNRWCWQTKHTEIVREIVLKKGRFTDRKLSIIRRNCACHFNWRKWARSSFTHDVW